MHFRNIDNFPMDDFFLMHWMENPNNLQMTQKNTHLLLVDSNDMKFEKNGFQKMKKMIEKKKYLQNHDRNHDRDHDWDHDRVSL